MADRMRRVWMPFKSGSSAMTPIAAASVARLLLPSVLEAEMGRSYESYTVTRLLLKFYAINDSGPGNPWTLGVGIRSNSLALADENPSDDATSDWLFGPESIVVSVASTAGEDTVARFDIRAQRKSLGMATETFLYIVNKGSAGDFFASGRMLVLMR